MQQRCPICGRAVPVSSDTLPFCSARCRLVDLGNWLDGRYRVSSGAQAMFSEEQEDLDGIAAKDDDRKIRN